MKKAFAPLSALLLALVACSTHVDSMPSRTATEQLLIATAAERAAARIVLKIPPQSSVFVDATNFDGTDSKNAIAAIRAQFLMHGVKLADDRKKADMIVEARADALSIDKDSFLIGLPEIPVPVPLTSGTINTPEIALYGTDDEKGVAKFAVIAYDNKNGTLVDSQDPQYGFAHKKKYTAAIFVSWTKNEALPEDIEEQQEEQEATQPPAQEAPRSDHPGPDRPAWGK